MTHHRINKSDLMGVAHIKRLVRFCDREQRGQWLADVQRFDSILLSSHHTCHVNMVYNVTNGLQITYIFRELVKIYIYT